MNRPIFCILPCVVLMAGCGGKPAPTDSTIAPVVNDAPAQPVGFDEQLEHQGIGFRVSSPNAESGNSLTILATGLEIDNATVESAVEGEVFDAEVADLDADGSPEVYVFVRSRDAAANGTVVGYAVNKRRSLSSVYLTPLSDDAAAAAGYRGQDQFSIDHGFLVRRFPMHADQGTEASPTGRTRRVQYALMPGEAGWLLSPVGRIIEEETVQFGTDATTATIEGELKGDATVDYIVRAAAGQTLAVRLQKSNPQNYFNVLPAESAGVAMFVGDASDDYAALLPDDGDYRVRVYLMRPAARRGESGKYTLKIGVTGQPIPATPAASDALVRGTRYHAQAEVQCVPAYESAARMCDASVVRRGFDGTATVVVPATTGTRTLLFVKGKPVASNAAAMDTLSFERKDDTTIVKLGDIERYEIPDALLMGG